MFTKKTDFDNFYCFQNVMRCGSFKKASEEMQCTIAQIKKVITQIEEDLQVVLFEPESEGKLPTAAGLFLYDKLDGVLQNLETTIIQTKSIPEGKALKLNIAISDMVSGSVYRDLIRQFAKDYPEVQLTLSAPFWSDMRRKLIDGSLDIGLTYTGGLDDEPLLSRKTLFRSHPVIVYSRDLFDKKEEDLTIDDFRSQTFACFEKESVISSLYEILQFEPKKILLVDSLKTMQLYVQSGLACAVIGPAQQMNETEGIGRLEIQNTKTTMGADLIWEDSNQNPARRLFFDCADKVFGLK